MLTKKDFFLSHGSKSPFLYPLLQKATASVSGKNHQQKTDAARFCISGVKNGDFDPWDKL